MGKKSVTKAFKTGSRVGLGMLTGGGSEIARTAPRKTLLGQAGRIGDTLTDSFMGNKPEDSTLYGDFSISPEQIERDRALILGNANTNSGAILKEGEDQDVLRKQRRSELANLLTGISDRQFTRAIPALAEDANAGGVYTGTGFSEALARERAMNTQDVQDRLAQQAMQDLDANLGFRTNALGVRTGGNEGALSRQFSLEDFIRSANVAKSTGQALQPKSSDGKAGTGALLSGIGALAPFGKLFLGANAATAASKGGANG